MPGTSHQGPEAPTAPGPAGNGSGERPLRSDARRNRGRILAAAEEIFAKEGLSVPIDEVARRAGVGVGTLYRHFPTKDALFEAIVLDRLDQLTALCQADDGGKPVDAFFTFLARMADEVSLKHDLFEALAESGVDVKTRCATQVEQLEQGVDALRRRAVEAGGVRPDVTTAQTMGLVIGTCQMAGRPDLAEAPGCRMLDVVFDGLRTRPS